MSSTFPHFVLTHDQTSFHECTIKILLERLNLKLLHLRKTFTFKRVAKIPQIKSEMLNEQCFCSADTQFVSFLLDIKKVWT